MVDPPSSDYSEILREQTGMAGRLLRDGRGPRSDVKDRFRKLGHLKNIL